MQVYSGSNLNSGWMFVAVHPQKMLIWHIIFNWIIFIKILKNLFVCNALLYIFVATQKLRKTWAIA